MHCSNCLSFSSCCSWICFDTHSFNINLIIFIFILNQTKTAVLSMSGSFFKFILIKKEGLSDDWPGDKQIMRGGGKVTLSVNAYYIYCSFIWYYSSYFIVYLKWYILIFNCTLSDSCFLRIMFLCFAPTNSYSVHVAWKLHTNARL